MKHTSRAAALALGLVTATLVVSASAYAAPAPDAPETIVSDGHGTVVTDAAGNALAVAGGAIDTVHAHFRYRHVGGRWSAHYDVPGIGGDFLAAASGGVNMPLIVGTGKGTNLGVAAIIRRTNATWTSPARLDAGLARSAAAVAAAGNADGDFAVSWTQFPSGSVSGTTYVSIRLRGGSWHRYTVGGLTDGQTDVGIDSYGNVTVSRTVTSSGSTTQRLLTRHKPVSGGWQAPHQVSGAGQSVRWHDVVIEPTGRETIAYQLVNPASDSFGDSYVLRQASAGGALGQVWHQNTSSLPSIAAAGGRLRVVWATVTPGTTPLGFTRAFNPSAGPVQELGDEPAGLSGVAMDKYGAGVVVTADTNSVNLVARPVTATTLGAGRAMQAAEEQCVAVHPALGAGSQYFVGVVARITTPDLPELDVFRASRL